MQVDYNTCGKGCQMAYISAKEAAAQFGMHLDVIRNMCHARGQRFAYQLVPNGKFYIDPVKLQEHIERKRTA